MCSGSAPEHYPGRNLYTRRRMPVSDPALMTLIRAIVAGDRVAVAELLAEAPALVTAGLQQGATAEASSEYFLEAASHHVHAGDTALHAAAMAYRPSIVCDLMAAGADVRATNRRGAQPLHYAADGLPGSPTWNPGAQAETIACLIRAGADPNAADANGSTPLHRAVRCRCAAAVRVLLGGGSDRERPTGRGSTALRLATLNTGRGGSGSPEARAQQAEILHLLLRHGRAPG